MKTLNDLTVPQQPVRKLLEKDVQKQCVDWARKRGYWTRKFSSMSQRSVPDYLFARMLDGKRIKFAVEFKRPGKVSTDRQRDEQQAMIDAGWLMLIDISNFEKFKYEVERIELTCCTQER